MKGAAGQHVTGPVRLAARGRRWSRLSPRQPMPIWRSWHRLFASTRSRELAAFPWSEAERPASSSTCSFRAQHAH
jgi:hypothetical protein